MMKRSQIASSGPLRIDRLMAEWYQRALFEIIIVNEAGMSKHGSVAKYWREKNFMPLQGQNSKFNLCRGRF